MYNKKDKKSAEKSAEKLGGKKSFQIKDFSIIPYNLINNSLTCMQIFIVFMFLCWNIIKKKIYKKFYPDDKPDIYSPYFSFNG